MTTGSTEVHARYQFTTEEFIRGNRWVLRSKARPWLRVAAFVAEFILVVVGVGYIVHAPTRFLGYFLLVVGAIGLAMPLLQRWMLTRAIRKDPEKDKWIEWHIDDQGARVIVGDIERTSVTWPAYTQVLVTPEGFLLYRGTLRLSWLPFRAFASKTDRERVQALIEEHIGDVRQIG